MPDGLISPFLRPNPAAINIRPNSVPSGKYWVTWADAHAKNSKKIDELAEPFKTRVIAFVAALRDAGAEVDVKATRRDRKRAYLFHWCWMIGLARCKSSEATPMVGVDIQWDHGDAVKSIQGAKEMIKGFGLAVPNKSKVAPALSSNHIAGLAVDMDLLWTGKLIVKKKDGSKSTIEFMDDPNGNTPLHEVGLSYGVKKHTGDAPHWSINGR